MPGNAVGAGRAFAVGEYEFAGPEPDLGPGVIAPGTYFCVGDTEAVADELGGVGVCAGFSAVPQAVNRPMPIRALAAAVKAIRRARSADVMVNLLGFCVNAFCGRVMKTSLRYTTADRVPGKAGV